MSDIKKLLARIGTARDAISRKEDQTSLDYMIDGVLMNCYVMLKGQEVTEQISDAIHETAKQFRQTIVRCKDCKREEICCIRRTNDPNWFCADGKRKDNN